MVNGPLRSISHSILGASHIRFCLRAQEGDSCPHCRKTIDRMVEKGVDAAIVTALYEGALNDSYDVALLLSNDADHIPAIRTIQDRLNKQIIHVGFKQGGSEVRTATWGHIVLDGDIAERLVQEPNSVPKSKASVDQPERSF